jgi:FecR protein
MELEKTIALLLAGTALITSPVFAQEVGTATAVNPESQSTPPGGSTTTLKVGARVVHKERIKTTPQGSVQLLFLDRSTLSIAPNSEIVIDEFVYNPGAGSGHMAVSLAKGALRLVGGQLSHQGEASVTTSGATIGIRGGTSIITLTEAININGLLTLGNGCPPVKRPGWKITLPCGPITQATAAELAYFISLFGGRFGGNGGVPGLTNAQLNALGIILPWFPPPPGTTPPNGTDPNNTIIQGTQHGAGTSPPPPPPPPPPPCIDCIQTRPK